MPELLEEKIEPDVTVKLKRVYTDEQKEHRRLYRLKNREHIRQKSQEYRDADPERHRQTQREYKRKYPERVRRTYEKRKDKQKEEWKVWYKEFGREYAKWYRENNLEQTRESQAKWRKNNPEKLRAKHRKDKYGLTEEQFRDLLEKQDRVCGICKRPFTHEPFVDHDHKTNNVRGLLCSKHNFLLGFADDDVEILEKAIAYLKKSPFEQAKVTDEGLENSGGCAQRGE
jgi:hypothetical protein